MTDAPDDKQALWVRTQPSSSGKTYVVTIDFTDDLSTTLKPSEAAAYAEVVLQATIRASHDAAVYQQLTERGLEHHEVARSILDLRSDRAPLRPTGTPLTIEPGVNRAGAPFLTLSINGRPVSQWTVEDARGHAQHVLQAVYAADLDAAYRRFLVGVVGLEESTALGVVGDLAGRLE